MFSFPSIRAWRDALLLLIPIYGAATVVFIFAFWLFFITFCILLPWYDTAFLFFLGMALIALAVGLSWYLLINFLYSLFLRLLWDKPPAWLKSPQSSKQKLVHFGIAIAATFPIAAIYVIHLIWIGQMEELTRIDYKTIYAPDLILKLSWLWSIAAAFAYHWKYLLGNKKNRQKR